MLNQLMNDLQKYTIGLTQQLNDYQFDNSYPKYNLEKVDDNNHVLTLALSGFGIEDIEISRSGNRLNISGKKTETTDGREFIWRGISSRNFEKSFYLADYVEVSKAEMKNGLLIVSLHREIPEEKKIKIIPITVDKQPKLVK